LIETIRNQFAFHVNQNGVKELLADLDPAKELPMIVGKNQANSLFWAGEEINSLALLSTVNDVTGKVDVGKVLDCIYRDLTNVARSFSILISGCLIAILNDKIPQGSLSAHRRVNFFPFSSLAQDACWPG
jgi:hypothetical protein